MIEGCIVAKLVLGYLKGEGLYRTCSAFQDECPLFHDDNKDLDNVFLTADLKTILDDYSQLREAGRENGLPSSTAVLKSLWKNLDIVIGQLKYATIPSSTPKTSRESQSTRTRRLNYGRARSSVLPKKQESIQSTTSSPSNAQPSAKPSGSNTAEKLPLPRLSPPVNSSPNLSLQSSSKNKTTHLQSTSTRRVTKHGVRSSADKEPANVHRTPSTVQSVGPAVAISSPGAGVETQVFRTTVDVTSTGSTVANSTSDKLSRNPEIVEDMFDSVDEGSVFNKEEFSHMGTENKSPPMIVIDNEGSKEQRSLTTEEESLSHLGPSQDESHLRSPKRKGIQPKKRVPQGPSGTSAVNESPVKQVPQPVEVEMDFICSSDSLTPQSFLGTLLSTPLLQEKLAENINKVVGSTRQQSASDELTPSTIQSLTTTEACSDDILPASIQGVGGDIPVKEIMDLMQADPAFDVLFSFFGLDALDALPSAANSTTDSNPCTLLPETSAESSQLVNPTSCVSSPGDNLPDTLGASSLLEEFQSDSVKEITSALSSASDQQMETPCSSSSSDLHLSATSIVTDALLLLAGSPQKIPPQSQSHLDHSANVLSSGKRNSVTPPKKTQSVQERLNSNDKRPCVDSLPGQAGLITSSFPYVRALDFNLDKGPEAPVKRGRKRDIKAKKGAKQATTTTTTTTSSDKQNKGPLTKKGVRINNKHLEATESSSSSSSSSSAVASYKNVQAVSSSTVATNVHTGIIQPIPNYGSTDPISSAFIPVVPISCSTGLPINIHSLTIRPDLAKSSSDALPSTVTYINPVRAPTSSLVTPVNSMSAPVNLTSAVTSHSSSPVDRTNLGTSPVLVNSNSSSTFLNPPTVSFTTCGTVHVSSPSTSANISSVCTTADVNLMPQHTLAVPSTVSFMNPITCPATTSTVNIACSANSHPGHPALPVSLDLSSTSSSNQVVNSTISSSLTGLTQAVLPGHSTDSSVFTSTTRINNSFTCSEQTAGDSNASGASATNSEVVQVATSPLSLQASNLLQSLALQYANTDKNETQYMTSGLDATPLRKERTSGFHETVACSVLESVHGHQALKEKSTSEKNMNLSQESATILSEKHKDNVSVVCETSSPDQLEKVSRDTATVATQLPNSLENKNGSSSTVSIMNQGCRELMKENSSSYLPVYSGTCSEAEGQGPSKRRGKRRRDSQQKEKEKKTNSSSRPSKRSKTKAESINFPTDLNVEEFLSKLHYEVK